VLQQAKLFEECADVLQEVAVANQQEAKSRLLKLGLQLWVLFPNGPRPTPKPIQLVVPIEQPAVAAADFPIV
jgi:hypothetical protein